MERILRMAFKKLAEDGIRLIRAIRGSIHFRSYLAANAASSLPSVPFHILQVLFSPPPTRVAPFAVPAARCMYSGGSVEGRRGDRSVDIPSGRRHGSREIRLGRHHLEKLSPRHGPREDRHDHHRKEPHVELRGPEDRRARREGEVRRGDEPEATALGDAAHLGHDGFVHRAQGEEQAVSYTHLTLPTNREV